MGVTETLARFAVETTLEDIPAEVIQTGKLRILDTLGVMVGGSVDDCTKMTLAICEESGGNPECNIVGHNVQTSRLNAAFVNGVAAHALDYDDIPDASLNHISTTVFPASLALAEAMGHRGADVLLAYILGYEVVARIGKGMKPHFFLGWAPQGTINCFGAAVSGAKILGLDLDQTRTALGIAGGSASGIIKHYGTMTKPYVAGNASRNGIVAALLASRGYNAPLDVLDSEPGPAFDHFGFCETFNRDGNYDLEVMVEGLGESWELVHTQSKHHPGPSAACLPTDLTLDLVTKHDIKPEDVERVQVSISPYVMVTQQGPHPADGYQARYSLWYNVAMSILDRQAQLSQYTTERVQRADVAAMLERIDIKVDAEIERERNQIQYPLLGITEVTIELKDGRVISEKRRGYPNKSMGWEEIVEKYHECFDYSGLAEKGVDVTPSIEMVRNLDQLPRVEDLLGSLAPAEPSGHTS